MNQNLFLTEIFLRTLIALPHQLLIFLKLHTKFNHRLFCLALLFTLINLQIYSQQITINEVMTSNNITIADEDGSFEDSIEIYNHGSTAVNIVGYGLTDDATVLYKWVVFLLVS